MSAISTGYTANTSIMNMMSSSKKSARGNQMQAIFQKSISERRRVISDLFEEKFGITSTNDDTKAYKTVAEDAVAVGKTIASLSTEEETNLYTEAEASGDNSAIYAKVKEFVKNYKTMASDMEKLGGSIQSAYGKKLDAYLAQYEEQLAKIGITVNENKTLSIDEETLESADVEDIKAVFAEKGGFGSQVSAVLADIVDIVTRAVNIREAMTTTYGNNANLTTSMLSNLYNSQA